MDDLTLKTLLGTYPGTRALKRAEVATPGVRLDFADVPVPNTAFRRAVRDLEFDVCELAIVTFLMAKARGVPLTLLPAVVLGRFQHPFLVHDTRRGPMTPTDLHGRRVGIRSWTVTTVAWLKGILRNEYDVDLDRIHWITFEDAHVAGFSDPPGVERAAPGKDLPGMLEAGEIDAAVLPGATGNPAIQPVIPNPAGAAVAWRKKYGAIQVNHLVAVKSDLARRHPDAVRAVYRGLLDSKRISGIDDDGGPDLTPFGFEANRRNLEVAIRCVHDLGLIPRRFTVEELFDDLTRSFQAV
jgi:4,5-dihydroxyphthalate decarboxylase